MLTDSQLLLAVIGALSAIVGAAVGSLPALLGTWLTKRAEERKHLRDLMLQAALENYKADREHARLMTERRPERSYKLPPLSEYIVSMSQIVPLMGRQLSREEAEQEVRRSQELSAAVNKLWNSELGAPKPPDRQTNTTSGEEM